MLSIALYLLTHAMLLSLHLSGGSFPRPLSAQDAADHRHRLRCGPARFVPGARRKGASLSRNRL